MCKGEGAIIKLERYERNSALKVLSFTPGFSPVFITVSD